MNGTFILITIFLYFGLLLLVARLTANRHTDNDAFFPWQPPVAVVHRIVWHDRRIALRSYVCVCSRHGGQHRHDLHADVSGVCRRLFHHRPCIAATVLPAESDFHLYLLGRTPRKMLLQDGSIVFPDFEAVGSCRTPCTWYASSSSITCSTLTISRLP